jgi:hypothetical protein
MWRFATALDEKRNALSSWNAFEKEERGLLYR